MSPAFDIAALRDRVRRLEQPSAAPPGVLPVGVAALDRHLPGGGLALGAVHEILGQGGDEEDGAAAAGFAAAIAARLVAHPTIAGNRLDRCPASFETAAPRPPQD